MANILYPNGKEAFAEALIDWTTHTINVTLVDGADYTYSAAHDNFDDVPSGARVATATLASCTNADGVLDAADTTFTSVTGDVSELLIIWKDTGVESTSTLIAIFDTVTGLPVTPNGGDILIQWNASGIIAL